MTDDKPDMAAICEAVAEILALNKSKADESHCSLARRFGYGATTVRYACNRVTWRHVP